MPLKNPKLQFLAVFSDPTSWPNCTQGTGLRRTENDPTTSVSVRRPTSSQEFHSIIKTEPNYISTQCFCISRGGAFSALNCFTWNSVSNRKVAKVSPPIIWKTIGRMGRKLRRTSSHKFHAFTHIRMHA